MTSTELLMAQAAILVLLFGVVAWIVRSSARQIRSATPPPLALEDPVEPRQAQAARPPRRPQRAFRPRCPHRFRSASAQPPSGPTPTMPNPRWMTWDVQAASTSDANLNPRLVIENGPGLTAGTELRLEGGLSIGRAATNGLAVDDQFMSHMHARILRRGPFFYVEDLGSTNGTFINDQRITGDAQLRVHDELRLGETVLRYEE